MIKKSECLDVNFWIDNELNNQNWRLKLNQNENIYGCSNSVISIIKNLSFDKINHFQVQNDLISKVAEKYSIGKDNIVFTNLKEDSLRSLFDIYIDKDDEIITYNKFDDFLNLQAKIKKANMKYVEFIDKFTFDINEFEKNITEKTKIAYIQTICENTGMNVRTSILEILIKKYQDILFVVDCSYINFSEFLCFEDYIDLEKKYKNVILIKSLAYDFALAGLGLNLVISSDENIANFKKVILPNNVNIVSLACASILVNDEKNIEQLREDNKKAKDLFIDRLKQLDFIPYPSEGNFILCDFGSYCDFYYEKLKKNGVLTKKYDKNSELKNCLRITIPTIGGVKYISELLNKKDVLIFNVDNVIFDVDNSYVEAIRQAFKYFTSRDISKDEIYEVKNLGEMNCAWKVLKCLLNHYNYSIEMNDIISVFQNLFYNSKDKTKKYLIDNDKLLISKNTIEELSQKYDLVIFSERFRDEIMYSFEKNNIDEYFYYFVTSDDLPKNMLKPNPYGVQKILQSCPHKNIKFLGSNVDDIIAGNSANVETIGIITNSEKHNNMVNNFRHLGATHIFSDIKNISSFLEEIK